MPPGSDLLCAFLSKLFSHFSDTYVYLAHMSEEFIRERVLHLKRIYLDESVFNITSASYLTQSLLPDTCKKRVWKCIQCS